MEIHVHIFICHPEIDISNLYVNFKWNGINIIHGKDYANANNIIGILTAKTRILTFSINDISILQQISQI
jgi:hypothetical protein